MLAMLNPCLCGGAVYIRRQRAGEEAYAAKSVLLHSSIKRDSNQSINMQKLWSDSEAKPRPWHDNDFFRAKAKFIHADCVTLESSGYAARQRQEELNVHFYSPWTWFKLKTDFFVLGLYKTKQKQNEWIGSYLMMQPVRWVWKWLTEWEWNYVCSMQTLFFFLKYCWGFISSSFSGCVSWLTAAVIYFTACMLSSFLTLKSEEALF